MKKFLIAILIIAIFIINASVTSSARIIIRTEETLADIRRIAESEIAEEELTKLRDYLWENGLGNREDLISFLKLLDSLPIPYIEGTRFSGVLHYFIPESTYVTFSTNIGETYSFSLTPNDENINRVTLFTLDVNGGRNINVYSTPESAFNEHGTIFYLMEIDGFLVRAGYNRGRNNEHITIFNPQEAYKDMIITSFAEAPWYVRPEPAPLTTADALAILRHVAGIELLPAADSEITTADALAILRIVAGITE
jgi:hypothetical protein